MEFLKKHKAGILFIVIVIAAFFVYSLFFVGDEEEALLVESDVRDDDVGAEMLGLLLELRSIDLEDDFFESAVFNSLVDFSRELVPQPVGRPNPFAPIGVGGGQE